MIQESSYNYLYVRERWARLVVTCVMYLDSIDACLTGILRLDLRSKAESRAMKRTWSSYSFKEPSLSGNEDRLLSKTSNCCCTWSHVCLAPTHLGVSYSHLLSDLNFMWSSRLYYCRTLQIRTDSGNEALCRSQALACGRCSSTEAACLSLLF